MKKFLAGLLLVGVTAFVTYLLVAKHMSEARATRLDTALMDAESRLIQMESELHEAQQQLDALRNAQLAEAQRAVNLGARLERSNGPAAVGTQKERTSSLVAGARHTTETATVASTTVFGTAPILYSAAPGSMVRIEGTSTVHDWQVEGNLIGGNLELPLAWPAGPNATLLRTNIEAKASVFIPVRSLKSVEPSGKPYSDKMDEIMYGKLRAEEFKRITFTLSSLIATQTRLDQNGVLNGTATGDMFVAGVTNSISMPVTIRQVSEGKLQVAGSVRTKMSDFQIVPPAPIAGGVLIKTGDEVTLKFTWLVRPSGKLATAK